MNLIRSCTARFQQEATEDQSTSVEVANGAGDHAISRVGDRGLLVGCQALPDSDDVAVPTRPVRYDIA